VLTAIAITTAMDATGYSAFSALPLFPLMALFWFIERHSRVSMGFTLGKARDYLLAALYPVLVLGASVAIAWASGASDVSATNWQKAWTEVALVAVSTTLACILTEEGFFRGWLFASLRRARFGTAGVLLISSLAFSLWHVSAVSLNTGFDLPAQQIPVYLLNATLLGVTWGLIRLTSGSVIVSSVSHGLWNAGAYGLFGYGEKTGALGIQNTAIFGPEVGYVGLALNLVFAAMLWTRYQAGRREPASTPSTPVTHPPR
jgi:membrane protease YdiL (CAAX protease family)